MKRSLCIALAVCMLLFASGCSLSFDRTEKDNKPDETERVNLQDAPDGVVKVEDMLDLPDDEMIVALLMQLGEKRFGSLNEAQKVVYTAAALEMEILNGGLVQFLVNERVYSAAYVCEALQKIGAAEHLELLQDMLAQNKVDLNDLSAFTLTDLEAFSKLYEQYDFAAFDDAYGTLPSMPDYIRAYLQEHKADF